MHAKLLVFPGWIILCLLLRIATRREIAQAVAHGFLSLSLYGIFVGGLQMLVSGQHSSWMMVAGGLMIVCAHALLFGWAVSLGASRFLWSPIGVLTRYWPASLEGPVCRGISEFWGRSSLTITFAVLGIDAIIMWQLGRYFSRVL